jgi:hypothetical protein
MNARKLLLNALMVSVFITCFTLSSVHAQVRGEVPDLSIWVNTWFKVAMTDLLYHFSDIGVKPTPAYPESEPGDIFYMKITNWDTTTEGAEFLVADVYDKKDSGDWMRVNTMSIYYFAGSNLKFVGPAQVDDLNGMAMSLLFVFTGKRNATNTKFIMDGSTKLSTMGGFHLEIDNEPPGSTERWAGSAKLSGPMVPVSQLPLPLRGL